MSEFASQHHILSVLVQNRPGVLARVAGLFARRGFNIFSLAVAPAEEDGFSRITIVVDVESSSLEQIVKQLFKLIEVVKISELDPSRSVERELLLATVRTTGDTVALSPPLIIEARHIEQIVGTLADVIRHAA